MCHLSHSKMIKKSTNLTTLLGPVSNTLYEHNIGVDKVTVKETEIYRWFEYGDESIQSLMDKDNIENITSPIAQAFLLFILMNDKVTNSCLIDNISTDSINVLNLGLGGASIERALTSNNMINITSVEASETIIAIAKNYFNLPESSTVFCQKAETFIEQCNHKFDVILCDIFVNSKNPPFLFTNKCYQQFKRISKENTQVIINSKIDDAKQLIDLLFIIKQHFSHIALIEFDIYSNLFIVCSNTKIPSKEKLHKNLKKITQNTYLNTLQHTELATVIENMRYIPHKKNQ